MIYFLTKILSYSYLLACAVGYSNRGKNEAVAILCIEGIKKTLKADSSVESVWYVGEFFKYAVPALLQTKNVDMVSELLSLVEHRDIEKELLRSEVSVIAGLSQLFYRQRNLQKSLYYILKAVEKKPNDAWLQYLCGWCYAASQDSDAAANYLKKSIELDLSYKNMIKNDSLISKDSKLLKLLNIKVKQSENNQQEIKKSE